MPMIIHGINENVGDVRILFEGDEPENDGLLETPINRLKYKAYLVGIIKRQYPAVVPFLLGNDDSPYR